MDASELAKQMLLWEQVRRRLDEIEEAIKDSVLQIGKTQTVGNVRASYSAGRKSYDYETAGRRAAPSEPVLAQFSKTVIDWRGICKYAEIEDIPFTQSSPSVSVKLLE